MILCFHAVSSFLSFPSFDISPLFASLLLGYCSPPLFLLEAGAALAIRLLANVEWDVTILDHMPDLTFHRDGEQDAKVDE